MLASVTLVSALPAGGESLPVEFFTRDDSFGTLKISPDGDFLAATATVRGVSTLAFWCIRAMQCCRSTFAFLGRHLPLDGVPAAADSAAEIRD